MRYYRPNNLGIKDNGTVVTLKRGESFESLLKRFKKKVMNAQIIQEVKNKQAYEKPSERRVRKKRAAIKRIKDNNNKQR